jgi:hypothetical protein
VCDIRPRVALPSARIVARLSRWACWQTPSLLSSRNGYSTLLPDCNCSGSWNNRFVPSIRSDGSVGWRYEHYLGIGRDFSECTRIYVARGNAESVFWHYDRATCSSVAGHSCRPFCLSTSPGPRSRKGSARIGPLRQLCLAVRNKSSGFQLGYSHIGASSRCHRNGWSNVRCHQEARAKGDTDFSRLATGSVSPCRRSRSPVLVTAGHQPLTALAGTPQTHSRTTPCNSDSGIGYAINRERPLAAESPAFGFRSGVASNH